MKTPSDIKHADRIRWNQKYRNRDVEAFGCELSDWLAAHENLLLEQPKGLALDLACGNGRNAFYLANLGFRVDAVDISDVAINWIAEQVRIQESLIYPQRLNLESTTLPKQKYQVILNFNYLERRILKKIKEALLPDGLLIFESFTKDHCEILGNQFNPKFLLDYNELLRAFSDLRILYFREDIVIEMSRYCKKKAVASLVARKTN